MLPASDSVHYFLCYETDLKPQITSRRTVSIKTEGTFSDITAKRTGTIPMSNRLVFFFGKTEQNVPIPHIFTKHTVSYSALGPVVRKTGNGIELITHLHPYFIVLKFCRQPSKKKSVKTETERFGKRGPAISLACVYTYSRESGRRSLYRRQYSTSRDIIDTL